MQLAEAELSADGQVVLRARAVRLRRGRVELPTPRGAMPPPTPPRRRAPDPFPAGGGPDEGFHLTAMEIRFVDGTTTASAPRAPGSASRARSSTTRTPSPLARAVAAADFGNGVSRIVDFDRYLFVNTDLTVHLHREPAGEWVLLDARTRLEPHGAGLAQSILSDERGPLGLAAQSLFVAERS